MGQELAEVDVRVDHEVRSLLQGLTVGLQVGDDPRPIGLAGGLFPTDPFSSLEEILVSPMEAIIMKLLQVDIDVQVIWEWVPGRGQPKPGELER